MLIKIDTHTELLDEIIRLRLVQVSSINAEGNWVPVTDRKELYAAAINALIDETCNFNLRVHVNSVFGTQDDIVSVCLEDAPADD